MDLRADVLGQTPASVRELQQQLLAQWPSLSRELNPRVREAFLSVPRHLFVDRFRRSTSLGSWTEVTSQNLSEVLPELYRDVPLAIWGNEGESPSSTISQPSFVLLILSVLDIQPGDTVFELGTGSGWNAALMAVLAYPGQVYTSEIIAPLAERARTRLKDLGIGNVTVISGTGTEMPAGIHFDRAIYTAGAPDLPLPLYEAVRPGGRLVFVLSAQAGADLLIAFDRTGEGFKSTQLIECGFVPASGPPAWRRYAARRLNDILLEHKIYGTGHVVDAPEWILVCRLERAREFLSLHDNYIALHPHDGEFAWRSRDGSSLLVAQPWQWSEYSARGDAGAVAGSAASEVMSALARWEAWGRPKRKDMQVLAVPRGAYASPEEDEIVMNRLDSTFVWRTGPPSWG